ncbi:hypothetical protein FOXB_03414, partial [Fusarium oxysporum f. sp. conglutinans Fo5176]
LLSIISYNLLTYSLLLVDYIRSFINIRINIILGLRGLLNFLKRGGGGG